MTKSIVATVVFVACVSGFAVSALADEMEMVRQDCEDEVAGYGIVDVDEQRQAVEDCVAMRAGSGEEGEQDMPMPSRDIE